MTKHSLFSIFSFCLLLGSTCLQAQSLEISLSTPANAGILSESCSGPYSLIFDRRTGNNETIDITVNVSDLGVAQMGIDYTFPVGTFPLLIEPIDTVVVIPITV